MTRISPQTLPVKLQRGILAGTLCLLACNCATGTTRNWTGAINGNWSNAGNWSPSGPPESGDTLWFGAAANATMLNDIPNLMISTLVFDRYDYVLNGNPLTIGGYPGNEAITMQLDHGSGSATFNCALILYTNRMTFKCWPVLGSSGTLRLNADLNLNGNDLLLYCFGPGGGGISKIEVAGSISGNGNVTAEWTDPTYGSIEFLGSAENTFTGTLFIKRNVPNEAAGIYFNKTAGAVVTNRLVVSKAADLIWKKPNQLGDHTTVVVTDGSRLNLNGYDETIGSLVLTNVHADADASIVTTAGTGSSPPMGTLTVNDSITSWVDNESILPTIQGVLNLPAGGHSFFVFGGYPGLDLQAKIVGFGGFSKYGNSSLLLKGTNTFQGTVYSGAGIIDVYNPQAFGSPTGGVVLVGGSVTLRGLTVASETLSARGPEQVSADMAGSLLSCVGACAWTGAVELDTNLVIIGDVALTGYISGPGGLGFYGGGTSQIGGPYNNTFTGTTLVRCPVLEFNKPTQVNAFAGPLVVGGSTGGPYEARWLNWYQNPATSLTLYANGSANLNNMYDRFIDLNFNDGGKVETGTGQLILGDFFSANPSHITVNASSYQGIMNGNLQAAGGVCLVTVADGAANPDLLINSTVSGAVSQLIKFGPGTLSLTGPNTYIATTIVSGGILDANQTAALGSSAHGTIVDSFATLRLSGSDVTPEPITLYGAGVGGTNGALQVTGSPTLTGGIVLSGGATINIVQGGGLAVDSVISGVGPLTKIGPGNLYLGGVTGGTGNNTYSGGTIVSSGPLFLSKNQNVLAAPGPLTIGPASPSLPASATWVRSAEMQYGGTVTVNSNSTLLLNGNTEGLGRLYLNDGGRVITGGGELGFTANALVTVGTLNPPQVGLQASASISGYVSVLDFDNVTFNVAAYGGAPFSPATPELDVPANIRGFGDTYKSGLGRMRFSGNNTFNNSPPTSAGNVQVLAGTLIAASPTALGGTGGFTIVSASGTLALEGGINIVGEPLSMFSTNVPGLLNLSGNNTWSGDIQFYRDSIIGVNSGSSLLINGALTGTGSLTKIGPGTLTLGGSADNTYSGDTFINEAALVLNKYGTLVMHSVAIPHQVTVGAGAGTVAASLTENYPFCIAGPVTVNTSGTWLLNDYESFPDYELLGHVPLTLNGNAQVLVLSNSLYLAPGGGITVNPGSNTTARISGSLAIYTDDFILTPYPTLINASSVPSTNAECLISGNISELLGHIHLQKEGAGTLRLTGTNTYTGTNIVNAGTLWVDGLQPQSQVQLNTGTRLKGSGTVGDIIVKGSSVAIAPGASPGALTCSNFNAGGSGSGNLEIELNGTAPGSGYDQLNVRGTVNLAGVSLKPTLGFASSTNDQFTIINNDGTDPVTNTLAGLPQAKKLYIGKELFQVNYAGGSGNDVVLARLVTPPPPTLTMQRVPPSAVRLVWATNDPPFSLQAITNLTTNTWTSALPAPVVIGTNNVVTNQATGLAQFFRLISP